MKIYAHRGASQQAPENTLEAIDLALQQGADGIEIDVRQHSDKLVVIHDKRLERTTNGTGLIENLDFAQLRTLDAGNGQQIPLLEEVIGLIAGKAALNIEIKSCQDLSLIDSHWQKAIRDYAFTAEQLLVSSFNHQYLTSIKQDNPRIRIGALTANTPLTLSAFAQALSAHSVNIELEQASQEYVQDAHQRGLELMVFTVDHPDDMRQLAQWGVDAIFTNMPDLAKQALLQS